jgi:hypothetical protein
MAAPSDIAEPARTRGTPRATGEARILATGTQLAKFIRVMPRDYKRALAELAAETSVA